MNLDFLLLFFGRKPTLQTITFSANTTWPCPGDVNLLNSVVGRGQNGTAPSGSHDYEEVYTGRYRAYSQRTYGRSDGSAYSDPRVFQGTRSGDVPDAYCDETVEIVGVPGIAYRVDCYSYEPIYGTVDVGDYLPGSTGANATGFGKTFAGGTPSVPVAPTTSYPNVAVTPSSSYTVVVPAGATIQITYYQ